MAMSPVCSVEVHFIVGKAVFSSQVQCNKVVRSDLVQCLIAVHFICSDQVRSCVGEP